MLLFIDEADAFLRRRAEGDSGMSEHMRAALNVVLHRTGAQQGDFMLVLATNTPSGLDPAVLDRVDEQVEFPKPGRQQREQMLRMYFGRYLGDIPER